MSLVLATKLEVVRQKQRGEGLSSMPPPLLQLLGSFPLLYVMAYATQKLSPPTSEFFSSQFKSHLLREVIPSILSLDLGCWLSAFQAPALSFPRAYPSLYLHTCDSLISVSLPHQIA